MISSFSQEQFQQFYEFSGGGGGVNNRKVPENACVMRGEYSLFYQGVWHGFVRISSMLPD